MSKKLSSLKDAPTLKNVSPPWNTCGLKYLVVINIASSCWVLFCRSESVMLYSDWLDTFESLLSDLSISWDGMLLITGDVNVDLLKTTKSSVRKYMDMLETFNLTQCVAKATRTTLHTKTLIDHIITNMPAQITHCDVLPCLLISDHDAPYACVNARVTRFVPRYKYIRDERNFDENNFLIDFETLPLSLVFSVDDPEVQVDILSSLIRECLDRRARIFFSSPLPTRIMFCAD